MIKKLANSYRYLLTLVRWNDWYDVRIPFVFIVILYFQYTTALLGNGLIVYLKLTSIFLFSLCYYAFLFLSNDYFDYDQDVRSGKADKKRSRTVMLALMWLLWIASIFFLILSWKERSIVPILIASVGYGLAFFYSAPPLRFKEKSFWGVIVGSTILRPLCILMVLAGLASSERLYEIFIYTLWLGVFGIRTMLFHQVDDYHHDLHSHVTTYVTSHDVPLAQKLISNVFLPAEYILLALVSFMLTRAIPVIGYALVVSLIYAGYLQLRYNALSIASISPYRPILGSIILFYLPVSIATAVAVRYHLWAIFFFVVFWQRRYFLNPLNVR